MKVVFLGTGSAVPTLKRGLSAVALIRKQEILLFDCGEGTQVQLLKAKLKATRIKKIFVSHMHGDHVTGLMGLLMSLELGNRLNPLSIFGPPGIGEFITTCERLFQTYFSFPLNIIEVNKIPSGVIYEEEEYRIKSQPLQHRVFTLGYSLEEHDRIGKFLPLEAAKLGVPPGPLFGLLQRGKSLTMPDGRTITPDMVTGLARKGKKLSYCVDTMPCPAARELAANADLLIYDGTFDPRSSDKALARGHSTSLEAAALAKESNVKRLVLTHLSPRYSSLDTYLDDARTTFQEILVAEDLMSLDI